MKYRKKPVVVEAWEFTRDSIKLVDSWVRQRNYRTNGTIKGMV